MATIAQQLTQLAQIKADIKAAIEAKGVTVGDASFDDYATLIASISGGGGSDINKLIDGSIESVSISGITSVRGSAFANCSAITSITIPEGVTSIGGNVFQSTAALATVDLPSTITSIGNSAFSQALKVGTIIIRATNPPTVSSQTFGSSTNSYTGKNATGAKKLYVPYGCSSNYTSATSTTWVTVLLDSSKCNFTIAELDANGNIPT